MAKSQRSKREKRLRTIRREITVPFYDKKDEAKFAAQEAALAAPKLLVRPNKNENSTSMETTIISTTNTNTDVEMVEDGASHGQNLGSLKPVGGIGKKWKKKVKMGKKGKRHGKGKIRRKHI